MSGPYYLSVDLGAGQGTKLAIFQGIHTLVKETILHIDTYGPDFDSYCRALEKKIISLLKELDMPVKTIKSIGIASAGILKNDGTFQLIANIASFNNHNLKKALFEMFDLPTAIDNDANAGALAEWSVLRTELLYWVFGGGWGGAWVSKEGVVRFPSTDWDNNDASLHLTNEPGYAIGLNKLDIRPLFSEVNASYERFEEILRNELGAKALIGPDNDSNSLRAETILSGPGRFRLFRAIVGDDDFYERFLDISEAEGISNPAEAGRYISKLSGMRVETAVNTDRLYGKILAFATRQLIRTSKKDGLPDNIPICLGGKPSYALPYFGPSAQRVLGKMGFLNYLRPSVVDERGINANLLGAAVLAAKVVGDI